MFEPLKIVALAILAAVLYGILHDQVTARVCVEYFTIGHPPVFATESPTLLGLGWGVIATWWMGVLLGVPGVVVCRVGSLPKVSAAQLVRPIGVLLATMAVSALIAGIAGYVLASSGKVGLVDSLASRIPQSKHAAFLADGFAHTASYFVGGAGGIVLLAWIVWRRIRDWRRERSSPSSPIAKTN